MSYNHNDRRDKDRICIFNSKENNCVFAPLSNSLLNSFKGVGTEVDNNLFKAAYNKVGITKVSMK